MFVVIIMCCIQSVGTSCTVQKPKGGVAALLEAFKGGSGQSDSISVQLTASEEEESGGGGRWSTRMAEIGVMERNKGSCV